MGTPIKSVKYERPVGLAHRLRFLRETDKFSDCFFVFGTEAQAKVCNAHQLILAAASPVFEAMFFGGMVHESPIKIFDIQPMIFEMLLDYIYTDEIELEDLDQAQNVWFAADKYMIPRLMEICETKVDALLQPRNACQIYEFAKISDRPFLLHRSLQMIIDRTREILLLASFKNVQLSTLLMILDCSKLAIANEVELLHAVLVWGSEKWKEGEEDGKRLRQVIDPALKRIRFLQLTPDHFATVMKNADILTEAEYTAIIMNMINVNKGNKLSLMPEGFSQCTQSRIK